LKFCLFIIGITAVAAINKNIFLLLAHACYFLTFLLVNDIIKEKVFTGNCPLRVLVEDCEIFNFFIIKKISHFQLQRPQIFPFFKAKI
jgi:hypothetical protein